MLLECLHIHTLSLSAVIFSGGIAQEQCQSLLMASEMYPHCTSLENCTGLTCTSQINNVPVTTTFVVNKCTDPLVVDVGVNYGNGNNLKFSPKAIGLQNLTVEEMTIQFNVTRNAFNVWVKVRCHCTYSYSYSAGIIHMDFPSKWECIATRFLVL